jgi:hypothetical protein
MASTKQIPPIDSWSLRNWPVIYQEAEVAKQKMLTTHRVVPLPVYDIDGRLIEPKKYKEALRGAIVRVDFTMAHWYITSNGEATNRFVADVKTIRILMNPPALNPSRYTPPQQDPGPPRRPRTGQPSTSSQYEVS